ncbi:MAG: PAS domain S-box protein [Synechocystis sp.]|nr:PAS domain S-box protein [Synechocystis sp.]
MGQIGRTVAIAIGYLLLGILSLTQLHVNHYVAGFWLPSGFVVALALQRGYGVLPGIFLGEMAIATIFNQGPLWMRVGVAVSQCLQGAIVYGLAPRLMKGKDIFASLTNLWGFLVAVLIAGTVQTLIGGWLIPSLAGKDIMTMTWFIGGFSGIVVFAPLMLSWMSVPTPISQLKFRRLEFVVLLVAALVGIRLVNWDGLADIRGFWLIVYTSFLFWGAFRFPSPIATTVNFFLVEVFSLMPPDIWNKGFDIAPNPIRVANVPILMTTYLIIALVVLVVSGDRQRLTEKLQVLNQQLQEQIVQQADELDQVQAELAKVALSITEAIPVGTYTMVLPADGDMAYFSFMSERFLQLCGLDRQTVEADPIKGFDCVHPDDYDAWFALNAETFAKKIPFCAETRVIVNGEVRWVRAESVPRPLPDGATVWEGVLADITETKRYEQQLQRANTEITALNQELESRVQQRTQELETSRAKFQRLVDDIGDQFVIFSHTGVDGIITYVSNGCEAIFGLAPEAIMGKSWASEINWLPDSLSLALEEVEKLLSDHEGTQKFEMTFLRADGQQGTLNILQHPVLDEAGNLIAIDGLAEDITERKQFLQVLAASESKYRTFIETANDLIYSIDTKGHFNYLSPNTLDILGFRPEEIQALPYPEILHPDDVAHYTDFFQAVMGGQKKQGLEYRVRHKNGSWRWHTTSASPQFNDAGDVEAFLGFAYDFTDRKLAELHQQQLNQELLKANQLKDEFLAMMSHELRTPLNAVLGMTESLEEEIFGPINDRQRNMLQIIYKSGSHLLDLINDILDLSKMEAGQMELELRPININGIANNSFIYVQTQAVKKHIHLIQDIPDYLPPVQGDERRLRQVLINLLNNAVKFTEQGGTVTVRASLVSIHFTQSNQWAPYIRTEVNDTGIGITPENIGKLFQPFIQIDSALNRKHEGTGLGLSLVKRIVEMHGGEVGVTSEVGRGSCFWFTLPCGDVSDSALNLAVMNDITDVQASPSPPLPSQQSAELRSILLITADENSVISIGNYLEAKGYQVSVSPLDPENSPSIDSGSNTPPGCVVLLIHQPHPDYENWIRAYRQQSALADVPIIVTGVNKKTAIDFPALLAAGANRYLDPPLKLRDLVQCIQQLLT